MAQPLWSAFEVADHCGWRSPETARAALARWRRERQLRAVGKDPLTGAALYLAADVRAARQADIVERQPVDQSALRSQANI